MLLFSYLLPLTSYLSLLTSHLCLRHWRIFAEPSVHAQPHNAEESLSENAAAHLAHAFATVDEYHRYFLYLETNLIGRVLHLYLEGISLESHLV